MLGLLWDKDALFKPEVRPDAGTKEISVPLSTIIDPSLPKMLRDFVQKAKDSEGRPVRELGQLTRDKFLEFYRKHTGLNSGTE